MNSFLPQEGMLVSVTDVSTSGSAPKLKPHCDIQDKRSPWKRSRFPPMADVVTRAGVNSSFLPKAPSDPCVQGETSLLPFSQVLSPTRSKRKGLHAFNVGQSLWIRAQPCSISAVINFALE